ncbi:hypothetical protein CRG98_048898, partial [Punica granatum]
MDPRGELKLMAVQCVWQLLGTTVHHILDVVIGERISVRP